MFDFNGNQSNTISPKDAYQRLKTNENIVLLDVRTPEEYKAKHLPNSLNIPLDSLSQVEKKLSDKNRTIFVYCLSGSRSMEASKLLVEMGYTNVYNLGGINSWPFGVVKGK